VWARSRRAVGISESWGEGRVDHETFSVDPSRVCLFVFKFLSQQWMSAGRSVVGGVERYIRVPLRELHSLSASFRQRGTSFHQRWSRGRNAQGWHRCVRHLAGASREEGLVCRTDVGAFFSLSCTSGSARHAVLLLAQSEPVRRF